jgi:hypothetical protein
MTNTGRVLVSFAVALALGHAPPPALAQYGDSAGGLEEIVVTARKRAESVLEVPV